MEKTITVTEQLWNIIHHEPHSIRSRVAREALSFEHEPSQFFNVLLKQGCISKLVKSLNHISDTHAFFEAHYAEIEDIRLEYERMNGEQVPIKGDLKNAFAWFSFEEVARYMVNDLGLKAEGIF